MSEKVNHGSEIVELLKEQGIEIDSKLENTINLLAYEIFNKGIDIGVEEGKKIGVNKACKEFEMKIASIRSKNMSE